MFSCGTSASLIPLNRRTVASATRNARSGSLSVNWLEISTPGIEPISSHPTALKSTLPAMKCPNPATYSSAAA